MGNNNLPIKVVCSSYDKYRRSYEDTSIKEAKTAIGAALVAGEYQLAVTLLFFCYTTLNHDNIVNFMVVVTCGLILLIIVLTLLWQTYTNVVTLLT
jgi:heme/copper-type cytochrome/quinol oxidase subunit 4